MELVRGPKLELVHWRDAFFKEEEPGEDPEDYIVATVGWVEELPLFLKVSAETLPDEDGKRAVTYIPNEMVIKRTDLVEKDAL